jgi:hypothetical protein
MLQIVVAQWIGVPTCMAPTYGRWPINVVVAYRWTRKTHCHKLRLQATRLILSILTRPDYNRWLGGSGLTYDT